MSSPADTVNQAHADTPLSAWIVALGWAGIIPFAVLAATSWASAADGLMQPFALGMLSAYAALVLSFLGAVHWGVVLARPLHDLPLQRLALLWGVAPSLMALGCLLMPRAWGLLALALVMLLARALDGLLWPGYARAARAAGWPDASRWTELAVGWLRLRTRLTAVVVLCLAAGWASAYFRA